LTVSDTGKGIDPSMLSRIFDPFEQADSSPTRQHHGLGLGLAIVRQIVEQHGGVTRAESPGVGQGATLTVDLPVLAVRLPGLTRGADAARDAVKSEATLRGFSSLAAFSFTEEALPA
jgi:hypothetical protein